MIITNIIFQKDKNTEKGYVYLNFRKNKKQKRISTKFKMLKSDFDLCLNEELPLFNPTKKFDYKKLNTEILRLQNIDPFEAAVEQDFVSFFQNKIDINPHGGTAKSYQSILDKLKKYHPVVSFDKLNLSFFLEYKEILIGERLSDGYIRLILTVMLHVVDNVNEELNMDIKINNKSLKLKRNFNKKDILLSDDDVSDLMSYDTDDKYFEYITFGLCQLFGSGCRFSDLILLRYSSFKQTGIEIQLPKTKEYKQIPYSIMLLRTMYRYIYRNSPLTITELRNMTEMGLNTEAQLKSLKLNILDYVKQKNKNDFFWSFTPKGLMTYDPAKPFTSEQYRIFMNSRTLYNYNLRLIAAHFEFDNPLSSHAFRYKFVANCIESKVGIYEISNAMNHSSIHTTELYIKKHFGMSDVKEVSNQADSKYLK